MAEMIVVGKTRYRAADAKRLGLSAAPAPAPQVEDPKRPALKAKVSEWATYAAFLGLDTEGITKDDLIAAVDAAEQATSDDVDPGPDPDVEPETDPESVKS
jgi:hypothetical protein